MISDLEEEEEKPIFNEYERKGKFSDEEALTLIRPSTYGQDFNSLF